MRVIHWFCCFATLLCCAELSVGAETARTRTGLLAFYDFNASSGDLVKDRSGVGKPVDLRIANVAAVRRSAGSLELRGKTSIRSDEPASKIIEAIRQSGEITIEAWIRPAKTGQSGPARIITLSRNANERNFTLGQDGDKYEVRLRTLKTSVNGIPSTSTPPKILTTKLTHVVYTRNRVGLARLYIGGKRRAEKTVAGGTNNWHGSFRLALGDELNGGRPWLGTYHLVAIYKRELSAGEVTRHFKAGEAAEVDRPSTDHLAANRLFETRIAPLLANHCLECHDSASKKGGLDLSRKVAAFAGGDSGPVISPKKASESLLWDAVDSDDMPKDRTPLSDAAKKLLRRWIDDGATWSLTALDPAVYVHENRVADVWVQRLTVDEYIETVRAAVGVDIEKEARSLLPPDLRADGFNNTAYNLNVDLKHVSAYAQLAETIVDRLDVAAFAKRFSKSRKLIDNDNRELISRMGMWLLRGPLEEHEVVTYRGIATTVASAGGDFDEAMSYVLESMLQSPRFIYRVENQRGDGTAWPVGDFELASRLSYILWGSPPDEELLQAAERGQLDRAGVERQVSRMLADPRARKRSAQFATQFLDLDRLDNLRPSAEKFPDWEPELASDMREETLKFFEHVVWKQQRPLSDLLNAQVTFATPRLAKHYGLKPQGEGFRRYDLETVSGRGGLLTQGSVLTVGGDEASMVSRGLFVLHELLRGVVKDPPPCVDTTPVPTKEGLTQRGIAEGRIGNVNCGGCHAKFEPLAFGLEKFDGLGSYHEADTHGNKLRDDGEILFPGSAATIKYKSAAELMDLLANSDRVGQSLTWKATQFALGRPLVAADARIVDAIHQRSQQEGGTYRSLVTAIVTSELVMMTRTESEQ